MIIFKSTRNTKLFPSGSTQSASPRPRWEILLCPVLANIWWLIWYDSKAVVPLCLLFLRFYVLFPWWLMQLSVLSYKHWSLDRLSVICSLKPSCSSSYWSFWFSCWLAEVLCQISFPTTWLIFSLFLWHALMNRVLNFNVLHSAIFSFHDSGLLYLV